MISLKREFRPVVEVPDAGEVLSNEARLILIFAMLENLATDLATMQRRGLWRYEPEEALSRRELLSPVEWQALQDWRGGLVDSLTEQARALSLGKVSAGRALVRRMIRHMVIKGAALVSSFPKLLTAEERDKRERERLAYQKAYQKRYWQRVKAGEMRRKPGRPSKEGVLLAPEMGDGRWQMEGGAA
jgi:hypothetical protein